MKLTTLLLLPILPLTYAATDYTNSLACAKRNPRINAAISALCNRRDASGAFINNIVVPSSYASKGTTVEGVRVTIKGTCAPAQWVPLQYCSPQFHAMCANGVKQRRFGRNKCQAWRIEEGAANLVGGLKGD